MRSGNLEDDLVSVIIPTLNEEENIVSIIRGSHEQTYRPIEVIVVDGGSVDETLDKVAALAEELSSHDFVIRLLKEGEFGELRSLPNARNIGVRNSSGNYLVLLDADMVLLDKDFILKTKEALDEHAWVSVRLVPVASRCTVMEMAQALEESVWSREGYIDNRHCIRKELFAERLFDPNLGFAEDRDLFEDYLRGERGLVPVLVDARLGTRVSYSFKRLVKRWSWYGRTCLKYYWKRYPTSKGLMKALTENRRVVSPFAPVAFTVIALALGNILVAGMFALLYLILRIRFYRKIPNRASGPFLLSSLLSTFVRPLAFIYGFADGITKLVIHKGIEVSRE